MTPDAIMQVVAGVLTGVAIYVLWAFVFGWLWPKMNPFMRILLTGLAGLATIGLIAWLGILP